MQPRVVKVYSKVKVNLTLHPLPKIHELYAKLSGVKIFLLWILPVAIISSWVKHPEQTPPFITPFGKWEFNIVLYGLAQAPAYFQALISKVLESSSHFVIAYLDDIIIFSKNEKEHLQHLEIIFKRLCEASLKLKRSKCSCMKMHTEYLVHLISEKGIEPIPDPDPQRPHVLFTDASKYAWAGVPMQPYTEETEGKVVTVHHSVTYMSGLFRGSQLNWAALTKEAYVIYMSIKKLSFYITDAEITLRSNHLPCKKFLLKNTLNSKVNNS